MNVIHAINKFFVKQEAKIKKHINSNYTEQLKKILPLNNYFADDMTTTMIPNENDDNIINEQLYK